MALVEEDLTRKGIGAFYRAYDRLGYGFLENVYVGALVLELARDGLSAKREVPITVEYDGVVIGNYRADLLVEDKLIIEVKADASFLGGPQRQLMNYLRCSNIEVGLLLVFGLQPQYKRVIHTRDRKHGTGK